MFPPNMLQLNLSKLDSELLSSRKLLAKITPKIGQDKYLLLIPC